jgi:hypothetical protein
MRGESVSRVAFSSRLSCVWDTAARHFAAVALWHWRSWASCNLLDRSPSRSRPELVASTAPWPYRLRQFSVSAVIVFRRQRTSDQSGVAYRGWTLCYKRRASVVSRAFIPDTPQLVPTIPTGELPHGQSPSGDGTRFYIALENATGMQLINTLTNHVVATLRGGQSAQALVYVPQAVPTGNGLSNLMPLNSYGKSAHLYMGSPGSYAAKARPR